jgi:hypothetical protein
MAAFGRTFSISSSLLGVVGGGPAGSSAALSATARGADVELFEKSHLPRHKVCGEFLSPEIEPALDALGLWEAFRRLDPVKVSRVTLCFDNASKRAILTEPAWGLSRWSLDKLLLDAAVQAGVTLRREAVGDLPGRIVMAAGRRVASKRNSGRLFGFKTHYLGPTHDTIELHFSGRWYVGVMSVEGGRTNVCGLAPEPLLARYGFEPDALIAQAPALTERLAPLSRTMPWLVTGPLVFRNAYRASAGSTVYPAGDALSFVDPFTGTGIVSALITGALAGKSAVDGLPVEKYFAECRKLLRRPFEISSVFRSVLDSRWANSMARLVPARWLFRLTRPDWAP